MKIQVNRNIDDENLVIKTYQCTLTSKEMRAFKAAVNFYDLNKNFILNKENVRSNSDILKYFKNMENNHEI